MNIMANEISKRLRKMGDKEDARFLQGFFKTGKGQYGEGDIFLGIRVPAVRKLAQEYKDLPHKEILSLMQSPYHEVRLFALISFVNAFAKGDEIIQKKVYDLYLANTRYINNWDLVDISAPKIVGAYLFTKSRKPLYQLVKSKSLWERRIAVLSTFCFIKNNEFADALKIAEILLKDKEDLIHKATGWMLREVGKRDTQCAEEFLKKHCRTMPRTMLRYAIERFSPSKRYKYLNGG
ncbi:MAG: DNA alkylation repair protein [Deltaproteobacteria bacterium HGW-Deltaproteobacteria-2]|jgi:3-methyladenine DNA glycosylase AlkD|nr:MAG: DNA alkylation repair protein [Deltaproteobacteria bacterium HGW-Deltaproteobacteria-2]